MNTDNAYTEESAPWQQFTPARLVCDACGYAGPWHRHADRALCDDDRARHLATSPACSIPMRPMASGIDLRPGRPPTIYYRGYGRHESVGSGVTDRVIVMTIDTPSVRRRARKYPVLEIVTIDGLLALVRHDPSTETT